jgi:NADH dehydrogenase/NADH:ubiquinone oxidoreductase subunit G
MMSAPNSDAYNNVFNQYTTDTLTREMELFGQVLELMTAVIPSAELREDVLCMLRKRREIHHRLVKSVRKSHKRKHVELAVIDETAAQSSTKSDEMAAPASKKKRSYNRKRSSTTDCAEVSQPPAAKRRYTRKPKPTDTLQTVIEKQEEEAKEQISELNAVMEQISELNAVMEKDLQQQQQTFETPAFTLTQDLFSSA